MKKLLVFANAKAGRDDEYNEWYDTVHIKDLLDIPGVVSGERYRVSPSSSARIAAPEHQYLTVYDVDGDVDAVLAELSARVGDGRIGVSDSVEPHSAKFMAWEPMSR